MSLGGSAPRRGRRSLIIIGATPDETRDGGMSRARIKARDAPLTHYHAAGDLYRLGFGLGTGAIFLAEPNSI